MESPAKLIEALVESVEAYGKTTYELSKLRAVEATTAVVTSFVSKLGVAIMLFLFVLVLNIGFALFLGDLLGKSFYGFFIVAAFDLVVAIVLHFFLNKWIRKPVNNVIISQILQ